VWGASKSGISITNSNRGKLMGHGEGKLHSPYARPGDIHGLEALPGENVIASGRAGSENNKYYTRRVGRQHSYL
jgi:hypothetical protein